MEKYIKLKKYEHLLEKYIKLKRSLHIKKRKSAKSYDKIVELTKKNKLNNMTDSEKHKRKLARTRLWRQQNKKKISKYNKSYYGENRENILKDVHSYYMTVRKKKSHN
jgi:hypothetical protein